MTVHRVHLADCPPQPWRNGGGTTRELLAWPQAADWQLRVSVADIERDGPFSPFPGVDRWFAVIEGAGVELTCRAARSRSAPATRRCSFDGEAAPACRLLHGPTRDLNLMRAPRRRRGGHAASRPQPAEAAAMAQLCVARGAVDRPTSPLAAGTSIERTPNRCPEARCCGPTAASPCRGTCARPAAPGG